MRFFLKSLFINVLAVFFVNYFLPGIDVIKQTKIPHIGGDVLFAIGLGLLNSLVYPILKVVQQQVNIGKIALGVLVVTFVSYAVLKFASLGIEVLSIEGYLFASVIVSAIALFMGYLEMKHSHPKFPKPPEGTGIIS